MLSITRERTGNTTENLIADKGQLQTIFIFSFRIGRKTTLVLLNILKVGAGYLCVWAPTYEVMAVARFILGIGNMGNYLAAYVLSKYIICEGPVHKRTPILDRCTRQNIPRAKLYLRYSLVYDFIRQTIGYLFGKEKYISEFICYQKLHFCTPVILFGI